MSTAAYYDHFSKLVKLMLKVSDSGSSEAEAQAQAQPQPQPLTSQDLALLAVLKQRDGIINIMTKKRMF
jgi:hypothetical protein